jgi:hypothetical protein
MVEFLKKIFSMPRDHFRGVEMSLKIDFDIF